MENEKKAKLNGYNVCLTSYITISTCIYDLCRNATSTDVSFCILYYTYLLKVMLLGIPLIYVNELTSN